MNDRGYDFAIYGAGLDGDAVADFLPRESLRYVIDGGKDKKGSIFHGKEVISPEDCKRVLDIGSTWVIISSSKYEKVMIKKLQECGINQYITREELSNYFVLDAIPNNLDGRDKKKLKSAFIQLKSVCRKLLRDKSSEVEFYMVDAFELQHYKPLYEALLRRGIKARIVCEPQAINIAGSWFDYDNAVEELTGLGIPYSDIANSDAKVAVTTQHPEELAHYPASQKILYPYGAFLMKKSAFTFYEGVADKFDCIFVHGDQQTKILREKGFCTDTVDISYPRYLNRSETREVILKKYGINTDKPILVYLPTWDEYGSIMDAGKKLGSLKERFYLIVKPHHCTLHLPDKHEEKEILYREFDRVLERADLYDISRLADVAVCDAKTGAVSEMVFLNSDLHMVVIYKNCTPDDFYADYSSLFTGIFDMDDLENDIISVMKEDVFLADRKNWIKGVFSGDIEAGIERGILKIQEYLS